MNINDQDQILLQRYIDNTGCDYSVTNGRFAVMLSKAGLPSHLRPFPAGGVVETKYRFPSCDELAIAYEVWSGGQWNSIICEPPYESFMRLNPAYVYRVAESRLPCDWEEMTQEKEEKEKVVKFAYYNIKHYSPPRHPPEDAMRIFLKIISPTEFEASANPWYDDTHVIDIPKPLV